MNNSIIFEDGYQAYVGGISKYNNPHEPGSINFDDWAFGWQTAREDRQEYLESIDPLRPEDYSGNYEI